MSDCSVLKKFPDIGSVFVVIHICLREVSLSFRVEWK